MIERVIFARESICMHSKWWENVPLIPSAIVFRNSYDNISYHLHETITEVLNKMKLSSFYLMMNIFHLMSIRIRNYRVTVIFYNIFTLEKLLITTTINLGPRHGSCNLFLN